jgi:Cu/Ag efflux protein CusF
MVTKKLAGDSKKHAGSSRRQEAVRFRQPRYLGCYGRVVATLALLLSGILFAACGKSDSHPLKGTIVDVYTEPPALLVDHEKIPGVMAAMTMQFGVDAATAARAQKGQKIEGQLRFQEGKWRLDDVKAVP